ncbi:methyl-accepting chemotaxis protein [Eubacteriaceae bacterium ES3]|nr:methyl-accepting chemotaxis protein [Eubacteriaceae bacterium ES3]
MEKEKKSSLLIKIVLLFGAILLISNLTVGFISISSGTNNLKEHSSTYMLESTSSKAHYLSAEIELQLAKLEGVADSEALRSMDWVEQQAYLSEYVSKLGYLDLAVITPDYMANYVVSGESSQLSERDIYEDAFNGKSGISNVLISSVTGKPVVLDVVPIRTGDRVMAILMGRRDGTALSEMIASFSVGETGFAYLMTKDGTINAHTNEQLVLDQVNVFEDMENGGTMVSFGHALQDLDFETGGVISYSNETGDRMAAVVPVPNTEWMLGIGDTDETLFAEVYSLRNQLIIIGIGIIIVSLLAVYLVTKRSVINPIIKLKEVANHVGRGSTNVNIEIDRSDEIGDLMESFSHVVENRRDQAQIVRSIAEGNLAVQVEPLSEEDEMGFALVGIIATINKLYEEELRFEKEILAGNLSHRGDAEQFNGAYSELISGLNRVVKALVNPLKIAIKSIERIGRGEIPPKITMDYQGDFEEMKNNINACIDGLGALVEGNEVLALMANNDFTQKIEGSYEGIYQEIVNSINRINGKLIHVVDICNNIAVGDMKDLADLSESGKRSDNDELVPSLIKMMENIQMLVQETDKMAALAVQGDLANRGDASQFPGQYSKVIIGFNQTLDAVIAPIDEASRALKELSQGHLSANMEGDFAGQHGQIKEDMNATIAFLRQYVYEISETLEKIADGDLSQEIESDYLGDFVNIKNAINHITTRLSETMKEIEIAASQVDSGSRQISDGGQALAQGTTEQASSIEELSASIEEVAAETRKNATDANEANNLAVAVKNHAETGNSQMAQMVSAMSDINESSNSISKIIRVIDDIAFQTNILALNAAVEAARAGQHGKGFAVVAEEVRTLAARSAEAAQETTELIEGSIDKVEAGTKIADETAQSLTEILGQIEKVTGLVANIAQASNDQASEIAQITTGIDQVSQVIQTNSATAQQSAASSEELSGQAQILKGMVEAFSLKQTGRRTADVTAVTTKASWNEAEAAASYETEDFKILLDDIEPADKY